MWVKHSFDIDKKVTPSHTEYLLPTDNSIVLDCHFNLAKKSKLRGRLLYNLIRFFDNLIVA